MVLGRKWIRILLIRTDINNLWGVFFQQRRSLRGIWKRWCTRQRSGLCCQSCPSRRENMMWKKAFSVWFASPCMSKMQGKAELRPQNLHQSYILHLILHLILHPKSSVNTMCLGYGCRKCRIFFQNIFRRERRDSGLGVKGCSIN